MPRRERFRVGDPAAVRATRSSQEVPGKTGRRQTFRFSVPSGLLLPRCGGRRSSGRRPATVHRSGAGQAGGNGEGPVASRRTRQVCTRPVGRETCRTTCRAHRPPGPRLRPGGRAVTHQPGTRQKRRCPGRTAFDPSASRSKGRCWSVSVTGRSRSVGSSSWDRCGAAGRSGWRPVAGGGPDTGRQEMFLQEVVSPGCCGLCAHRTPSRPCPFAPHPEAETCDPAQLHSELGAPAFAPSVGSECPAATASPDRRVRCPGLRLA